MFIVIIFHFYGNKVNTLEIVKFGRTVVKMTGAGSIRYIMGLFTKIRDNSH